MNTNDFFTDNTRQVIKELHHPGKFGKSKYGIEYTFKVLNDLVLLLFQKKYLQKPIYLFGNFGLVLFSIGTLIILYLLAVNISGRDIACHPLSTQNKSLLFIENTAYYKKNIHSIFVK